jgi:preprotein translocase subunit SecD
MMRTARYLAIVPLLLSAISCAGPQSIELLVQGAALTRNLSGRTAIDVSLSAESAREFAIFTSKIYGRYIEVRFLNETLTRAHLNSPIGGGHFQISTSPNGIDGTLNEDNVAEIARKLSTGNAKLEVRVADERK